MPILFLEKDEPLDINPIFKEFAEFTGYRLLKTTKELAYEGKKMNHCVATYTKKVNSHRSGIYSINEYTLELIINYNSEILNYEIKINQFRGYKNELAPEHLYLQVENKVNEFNAMTRQNKKLKSSPIFDIIF